MDCGCFEKSAFMQSLHYNQKLFAHAFCFCCCYLTPSERCGHGGRPLSPRSRATPESLNQAQRVCSWSVQNGMRGVLGLMSAGAAGRILDSANPRKIRAKQKAVSVAAKTGENTASVTREHKLLSGNRGNLCIEKFR